MDLWHTCKSTWEKSFHIWTRCCCCVELQQQGHNGFWFDFKGFISNILFTGEEKGKWRLQSIGFSTSPQDLIFIKNFSLINKLFRQSLKVNWCAENVFLWWGDKKQAQPHWLKKHIVPGYEDMWRLYCNPRNHMHGGLLLLPFDKFVGVTLWPKSWTLAVQPNQITTTGWPRGCSDPTDLTKACFWTSETPMKLPSTKKASTSRTKEANNTKISVYRHEKELQRKQ